MALATLEYAASCVQWFIRRRRDNSIRSGRSKVAYHPSVRLWMVGDWMYAQSLEAYIHDATRTHWTRVKEWTGANIGEVWREIERWHEPQNIDRGLVPRSP